MKKLVFLLAVGLCTNFLTAQNILTGQVTDENGESLPGANVHILETKQVLSADEKGVYRLENLKPGTYNVRFSFVGYEDETRQTELREGYPKTILHVRMQQRIVNLDNVNVLATRAGAKAPFTYSMVDKETIEERNLGQDVPFVLRWSPSTVVTSDAGAGIGYTYMRIRGIDGGSINVNINGVPLNDAESQQVFWVDLPDFISSTDNVQIQRGIGTSTNGSGAFGASINLNTSKFHKEAYATFNASGGSFNTRRANVQFGSGLINDKFTFDGRLSRILSDGYIDRASSDLKAFYLSGAYLGKKSSFRINVFSGAEVTYQAWNGVPYQWKDIEEAPNGEDRTFNVSGTEKAGDPHDNEVDDYTQTHYQALYNYTFNRNWNLNITGHYTKGFGFFEQYRAGESFGDYGLANVMVEDEVVFSSTDLIRRRWLDNDFYGATWALNYIRNDNQLQVTFGGAANQYKGDHFGEILWANRLPAGTEPDHRYYDGTGDKVDFNVYGKANIGLTPNLKAFVDLQYRSVNYEITGTDNDLRDVSTEDNLNFFNPKFGLYYDLNDQANIYASFARANREPNRNDYTDAPQGVKPRAEVLNNVEVGYRQNWQKAAFGVNFYLMDYKDQLVVTGQVNDVGAAIRVNVPDSYRAGIELVGGFQLTKKLSFQGTATFSQNKIKSFTSFVDEYDIDFNWLGQVETVHTDSDISFSPRTNVSGELTYDFFAGNITKQLKQELSVSLLGKYVGSQFIDNTSNSNAQLDAYFFSDLRLNYSFKPAFLKKVSFTLLVQNVFNELFENNAWVYRYIYPGDAGSFDPYVVPGSTSEQNMIGVYPQATRNILLGVSFEF